MWIGSQVKPLYKYGYWVHDPKTKDVKNHWEHRDGDAVYGSYSLLQPDGHMRVVEYTADKHNGFNAHVKYMYEGHGGGSSSDGGGSGGGGGANPDNFSGAGFGQHLDDLPGGQSQQIGGRPKQSLNKYYKKPRAEKHGGTAGTYKRPNHFDVGRPKSAGGGYKKQRLPPAAEQSAEHYGGGGRPNGHFDQLSSRFPSVGGSGGSSPEHYQTSPVSVGGGGGGGGGNSPFGYSFGGDQGSSSQSSDHFSRKYSTLPAASAETSVYHSGIQYQSSEHDLVHHRPDVAPAASTEHAHRGGDGGTEKQTEPQQPSRAQRSREDGDEPAGNRSQETMRDNDEDAAAEMRVKKQPLMEYHFEEPPYPFEIPEGLTAAAVSGKFRAPHHKRHTLLPAAPRYLTTSSYFPTWFDTTFSDFGQRPDDF